MQPHYYPLQTMKQVPRLSMKMWLPLLHCSLGDLESHLQVIAQENPCIDINHYESRNDQIRHYFKQKEQYSFNSTDRLEHYTTGKRSLYEILDEQIAAPLFPTPISQRIAKEIIFYINDEGYFEGDVAVIAEYLDLHADEVERVRQRFAHLEPSGVGAVDFKESFLFQLGEYEISEDLSLLLSSLIIQFDQLEKFIKHPRFPEAKELLKRLKNPPALIHAAKEPPIIPEMHVYFVKDELKIEINNRNYPDVTLNEIHQYDHFAKTKFKEARELVKLLELRKATLYNIMLVVIEKQFRFFCGGELTPLKMQEVADALGYNESTISRAIAHKYIQTDRGMMALREFFTTSVDGVSSSEIKHFIKLLIESEDPKAPHSDKYLHESVEVRFKIRIVRRSIAKYRQEMGIPAYHERRFLYLVASL